MGPGNQRPLALNLGVTAHSLEIISREEAKKHLKHDASRYGITSSNSMDHSSNPTGIFEEKNDDF